ncbi:DNA-binding protein HU-alpha [Magnetospirillum sp. SS-4]|nr:DNA-binding protein HU-alpha [Magnetospirillum sp. SS-4]
MPAKEKNAMSKSALSKSIRAVTGCSVAQADAAVEAVLATIVDGVKTDGSFRLIGFGTFAKAERPARRGRNPKTGEAIDIAASTSIKFSTAAALKKSL